MLWAGHHADGDLELAAAWVAHLLDRRCQALGDRRARPAVWFGKSTQNSSSSIRIAASALRTLPRTAVATPTSVSSPRPLAPGLVDSLQALDVDDQQRDGMS